MEYMITDGINYIAVSSSGSVATDDFTLAQHFSFLKANNFVKALPIVLRDYQWRVEPLSVSADGSAFTNPFGDDSYSISDKVDELSDFSKKLIEYEKYLLAELSKTDLAIVDIEHAAEFQNLNVVKGYKLYKLLQEKRIRRRHIKNEIEGTRIVMSNKMTAYASDAISKSIAKLDEKKYAPRVLKELFI